MKTYKKSNRKFKMLRLIQKGSKKATLIVLWKPNIANTVESQTKCEKSTKSQKVIKFTKGREVQKITEKVKKKQKVIENAKSCVKFKKVWKRLHV